MNDTLQNIITDLQPWWGVIEYFSLLFGLGLVIMGLIQLGRGREGAPGGRFNGPAMTVLAGFVLLNTSAMMDSVTLTIFESASNTGLGDINIQDGGNARFVVFLTLSLTLIMLIGYMAFVKGGFMLKESGSNAPSKGAAISHIVGGIFCVNFDKLIMAFAFTIGGQFLENVTRYFG